MNRGFYTIMAAQFFSSLADNALLFVAIDLLVNMKSPAWITPLLKLSFTLFYVLLAAFVGAFADSMPKGKVMFISNLIKVGGCLLIFARPSPAGLCRGRLRRGGLLAGQVRHPDRIAAARETGRGQRLDRRPDRAVDHPRHRAGRRTGRRRVSSFLLASTCR
jgi:MFS family permease